MKRESIVYERIDLILPERSCLKGPREELDSLNRFEIGKIDFLNDTAQVRVYYYADEQEFSDYHVQ